MAAPTGTADMLNDAIDFTALRRVLVIKLRHHGDVLLSSPIFHVLKNHHPHLEVDALVYKDTHEMLSLHPDISELMSIDRNWKRQGLFTQLREERALHRALKQRTYDLIIHLTDHRRGALLSRWLKPRYAVTAKVARGRFWRNSFTHHYPIPQKQRHTVEKHLDALRRLGLRVGADERALILQPGDVAQASIMQILNTHQIGTGTFIHLHPTSRWLFKCWEEEKFAQLIDALAAHGFPIVITAAPDEKERAMVARIRASAQAPTLDLSGALTLKELAALSAKAACFVGVDSAPMHIAAAVGTPVVALFGPSGDIEWAPWQTPHRIIVSDQHPCRPCGQDGCGGGKISECLTTLPVAQVMAAINALLKKTSHPINSRES